MLFRRRRCVYDSNKGCLVCWCKNQKELLRENYTYIVEHDKILAIIPIFFDIFGNHCPPGVRIETVNINKSHQAILNLRYKSHPR